MTALAAALTMTAPITLAQTAGSGGPVAGTQEITLGGSGGSDKSFDDTTLSLQGSWGKYLNSTSMWGVRQTINVRDSEESNTIFSGATRVFYDYHFGTAPTRPFIGASFGGFYGRDVRNTFSAGPELGVKHWLKSDVFIGAMVEYQFLFRSGRDARDRYDDGALLYSVNLGYNF
jgi:hypothetical protein